MRATRLAFTLERRLDALNDSLTPESSNPGKYRICKMLKINNLNDRFRQDAGIADIFGKKWPFLAVSDEYIVLIFNDLSLRS